jgi:phage gpG-like protein
MAGAGIEIRLDADYQRIIDALNTAKKPDLKKLARFAGLELADVSEQAFHDEADPVTGAKWAPLKAPRANGETRPVLWAGGQLHRSLMDDGAIDDRSDGTVVFGTNMVYGRIHQEGGRTRAHEIRPKRAKALRFNGRFAKKVQHPGSDIPARPYLGVPRDFDRRIMDDPYLQRLLNLGG